MKAIFRILFGISLFSSCLFQATYAVKYVPSSFGYFCQDSSNNHHLMPIALYEFDIESNEINKLEKNYFLEFNNIAPRSFAKFNEQVNKLKLREDQLYDPVPDRVDSILTPPKGCKNVVVAMLEADRVVVNKSIWPNLTTSLKRYYLGELLLQSVIKDDMSPIDIRRFNFYFASQRFFSLYENEKIYFLSYYGINEYRKNNILIDTSKENIFYADGNLKDGYAIEGAIFLDAKINNKKYVSFYPSGKLQSLSTLTPFKYEFNGQNFTLYSDPEAYSTELPRDQKKNNRIHFYEDGNLRKANLAYPNQIFNFVTNIKASRANKNKFLGVYFYSNGVPASLYVDYGEVNVRNYTYEISGVEFHENGIPSIIYLFKKLSKVVLSDGKITEQVGQLFLDESGAIIRAF